jgi:hypothetical protein
MAIAALIAILLGGGGWYYFFGRKPKVVLSVPLKANTGMMESCCYPLGDGEVLVLAGGELKRCDLGGRTVKWSASVPPEPNVDRAWQASLNARFVQLQQWATALAQKRAALTTPQATKAFNDEVAKYQAMLTATRADAAKPPPPKPAAAFDADFGGDDEEGHAPVNLGSAPAGVAGRVAAARAVITQAAAQTSAADSITIPKVPVVPAAPPNTAAAPKLGPKPATLNPIVLEETRILQDRIKKRVKQLADMDRNIQTKAKAAATPLAKEDVKMLESKRAALAAEQQADEAAVAKALGSSTAAAKPAPAVPVKAATPAAPVPAAPAAPTPAPAAPPVAEEAMASFSDSFGDTERTPAQVAVLGEWAWVVEGVHAAGFSLSDGSLKADVRLAGPVVRLFADANALFIVTDAGPDARQLTRIATNGVTQSLYLAAPRRQAAFAFLGEGGTMFRVNAQANRTEFTGGGGSLARVDIRLIERNVKTRDAIKPGTEQSLTKAIQGSAGNSTEEVLAIANMMEVDSRRMSGDTVQEVDESTYEVTLSRPFEATVPLWTGRVKGRVEVFSTATLDLITAGTKLLAFDRTNKALWEATLGAPIPQRGRDGDWEAMPAPVREEDGKLLFADGAFLSAFQAVNGQVLWRLPSVGIRKIDADADGNLYVQTDNLSVDTLTFLTGDSLHPPTSSTLKVDAGTGKILWDAPKFEDVWVSGKDVYAFREIHDARDLENQVFDPGQVPEARVKFYKLSRSDGKPIWEWYQSRRPHGVVPSGKHVAILFRDELQVIHSIAL